jgi:hypothetical protein
VYLIPGEDLMRNTGVGIGLAWFVFSAAVLVFAQDKDNAPAKHLGKAGRWEVTTTMTWQKSPVPPGSPGGPPAAGTHTTSVCLTQEMIDAGALLPQSRGNCRIQNKVLNPGTVTADYVCTGKMKGKGMLETTFADLEHVTSSIHFQGTLDVNSQAKPIEWTTTSSSVFKDAQCKNNQSPASASPTK